MSTRKTAKSPGVDLEGGTTHEPEALVDTSLIDEMLRLTPEERLLQNARMIRTIMELRDALRST